MKYFSLVFFMLSILTVKSIASVAAQSDWSGGDGLVGPIGDGAIDTIVLLLFVLTKMVKLH